VRRTRLRTKFLLSLLAITAGLTSATLYLVSYSVQKRVRAGIWEDLRNSVNTYQTFERQRQSAFTREAELLANLPNVRALMTTQDRATIQDESASIRGLGGSDLLGLADRSGTLLGLETQGSALPREEAQELLRNSLQSGEKQGWWVAGGHIYEVWLQPVYFGASSHGVALGVLLIGDLIDDGSAKEFGTLAGGEVVFRSGNAAVASTLSGEKLVRFMQESGAARSREIQIDDEHYLVSTIRISSQGSPEVRMSVLKSLDKATLFLRQLNQALLVLGLVSVLAGSTLVFFISHTFTRPLESLVAGVRALREGDFSYPLESSGSDEVAEVTAAFAHTRESLRNTQEEQKRLEERLRQAHKMEAVGRLAGGVAHDFNNLLTVIRGNSDLLLDRENIDAVGKRYIEQIQKAAGRAVSMTRQLLAFSRMQVLQPRVLDLNTIVAEMGKMLPRLIGEDIEFVFLPEPNLALVQADPSQMEQVLLNLAVNARDAMPEGGTLTVRLRNAVIDDAEASKRSPMTAGAYVLLAVTDTGVGMDEKTKAHIFEPFFTTKAVGKGTGLGLATVYGVVKQSGGFIWVDSALGKGTTFTIYLPFAKKTVMSAEKEESSTALAGGSETILVVEDEAEVRELACQFLQGSGYKVLDAKDGVEALELAMQHSERIHLVLSDMVMPRMSGTELATQLKNKRPDLKILFMTGYAGYSAREANGGTERRMMLQKPFSRQSLLEKVRETLIGAEEEQVSEERDVQA